MKFKHIKSVLVLFLMNHLPLTRSIRYKFARKAGVNIVGTNHYIGKNVVFDSVHPELITLNTFSHIASEVVILTHYLDTDAADVQWKYGEVIIGENAFVGMRTIITKPLKIGRNSIVGAGSVVTKDIPDNEIWGGNPARFIKKREVK